MLILINFRSVKTLHEQHLVYYVSLTCPVHTIKSCNVRTSVKIMNQKEVIILSPLTSFEYDSDQFKSFNLFIFFQSLSMLSTSSLGSCECGCALFPRHMSPVVTVVGWQDTPVWSFALSAQPVVVTFSQEVITFWQCRRLEIFQMQT